MAFNLPNSPYNGPPPLVLEYSDDDMAQIHASAELTVFIQLFGRKMGCYQLGSCIHGFFNLDGRVEVTEHGHCRYSAKFSSQGDYDRAIQRSSWQISDHHVIEVYKWEPNFQFGKVPLLAVGDFVEARVEGLPVEYCIDNAVLKIGNAVCEPLGCPVYMVDTLNGKPPRFWFLLTGSTCLDLPLHVQINGGPLVGLSYSRAQQCYHCGRYGHFRKTCPELNQRIRSPNRATPSNSGPIRVHRPHLGRQPAPVSYVSPRTSFPAETHEGTTGSEESHEGTTSSGESHEGTTSSEESHEETTSSEESHEGTTSSEECHEGTTSSITPFSPIEFFAGSSGSTSPSRLIEETKMSPKGAMLVENGMESKPKCYNMGEEVSGIDVAVRVSHLNYQRGNQRWVSITPRAGDGPRCSKKLLCTSIENAEDRNAIRAIKDTCYENNVSMAIVFDKSSVLSNDDRIVRCFGFSDSYCAEMIFRRFREDGSAVDVKGNCLLMWNAEELRVNVSPVSYGNTPLLSQHLEFNASWVVSESDSDESSNGFSSSEGEGSIGSSVSSDEYSRNGDIDSDESSLFSSAGEGVSNESSASSSSSNESLIFLPNGATDSEASSLFSTDAEEISNGSSAPSSSEEGNDSFILSPNGE
ncbi:uncharacterized protein LOC132040456 [Lycium ferocissimum]|uniref:uncharacterized protein LOC132040456 n=1 Tax=Lycium ferocissimum TaxID=112874 RepID=UPI002815012F|nr:uncharacterized protein LOC132040456 [Lycium ferocissimum]